MSGWASRVRSPSLPGSMFFEIECGSAGASPSPVGYRWGTVALPTFYKNQTMTRQAQVTGYDPAAAVWRRRFSFALVVSTIALIFLGGQVKSHEAGLAVPDWPNTFGYFMFLFPIHLMQGGIFHEHLHRLVASGVGFMTLVLAVWCWWSEPRKWVRVLSYVALAAVIVQGVLGGLTVLYLLPTPISVSHGLLAQTFLLITVVLAYAHSIERDKRSDTGRSRLLGPALVLLGAVYVQLFLGATMRHMEAGLAIPDFPTTAGSWTPWVTTESVEWSNAWREEKNWESDVAYAPVTLGQVGIHLAHRYGAVAVLLVAVWVTVQSSRHAVSRPKLTSAVMAIDTVIFAQIVLGILTVISLRVPEVASLHVVTGACLLALCMLLVLRAAPMRLADMRRAESGTNNRLEPEQVTT